MNGWIIPKTGAQFSRSISTMKISVSATGTPPFAAAVPRTWRSCRRNRCPTASRLKPALKAKGANGIKVRYRLPHHTKALHIDMLIDKTFNTRAEAVYVPFPQWRWTGIVSTLISTACRWNRSASNCPAPVVIGMGYTAGLKFGNDDVSVTIAPLDSPLIQVGGITTGRWAEQLDCKPVATLVSWALHNHWDTNFKASQGEPILQRYRLTSSAKYDPAASSRFAMDASVPPLIVRVPHAALGANGVFMAPDPEGECELQLKRAEDGRGLIVHAYNLGQYAVEQTLRFPELKIDSANLCNAIEVDGETIPLTDGCISFSVPARSVACARVIFANNY